MTATAPHIQPNAIHPNSRNAESALSETDKASQRHQILSALWLNPSGLIRQELEGSGKTRSGCKAEKLVLSMAGKLALGEVP